MIAVWSPLLDLFPSSIRCLLLFSSVITKSGKVQFLCVGEGGSVHRVMQGIAFRATTHMPIKLAAVMMLWLKMVRRRMPPSVAISSSETGLGGEKKAKNEG